MNPDLIAAKTMVAIINAMRIVATQIFFFIANQPYRNIVILRQEVDDVLESRG